MNKCKIFLLITSILSGILFSISSNAANINIYGLETCPAIQSYLDKLIISNYPKSGEIDIYALKNDVLKAVKAKGYYSVKINLDKINNEYVLIIDLGNIYRISQVKISGYDYSQPININKGDILDAEKVLSAQKDILRNIKSKNCYYTLSIRHEITLDHNKQQAALTYYVATGQQAKFGKISFKDLKTVKHTYINSLESYHHNECWDVDKVETSKSTFMKTGLFSYIKTELPPEPDSNGLVDFNYVFVEKPPRSIRLGVSYQTDEGPGFQGKWSHRNLFGAAEGLALELKLSYLIQSIKTDYSKPHFFGSNRSLSTGALLERKNTDAYEELNFNVNAYLKNKHTDIISSSLGVTAGISEVKDESDENYKQTFGLISFPGMLTLDSRDSTLDSHKGSFSQAQIEPFADILSHSSPFLRLNFLNNFYIALDEHSTTDPVLAVRTNFGTILGEDTDKIPASKRYFAGGGNSIRGFEFQHVGPFKDGNPTGGRSLIELSSELRVKITNTIGMIGFVDAGNVYNSHTPEFSKGLCVGAGAGIRYYTDFGPIRLDIATPINKLENNGKRVQFYISLGQAF